MDTELFASTIGVTVSFSGLLPRYRRTFLISCTRQVFTAQARWKLLAVPLSRHHMPPPAWLLRWRRLLKNIVNFVYYVNTMVLHYSMTALHGALKDRVLSTFGTPCTARTLLTTTAALTVQSSLTSQAYMNKPENCSHPSGLRGYGAGGVKIKICDLCGSRWVVTPKGMVQATPKAAPQAKTPLNLPEKTTKELRKKKDDASVARGSNEQAGAAAYPASWRHSSTSSRAYAAAAPAATRTPSLLRARPKATAPPPRRRQWLGTSAASDTDRMSTGTYDQDWTAAVDHEDMSNWVEPNMFDLEPHDHMEGSEGSQFDPNDLIPPEDYEEDYGEEL